jgi:hypothetical protein
MRVFQGAFALGMGLVAGALVWAIAGQSMHAKEFAGMAFVGGVLMGIATPAILSAIHKAS